jgi:hypothetical protein
MSCRACLFALVASAGWACDAKEVPPPLTAEQIADATFVGGFSIPNAGELFAAFNKLGRQDWSSFFRKPPATPLFSRPQIALSIGVLIADGFLAAEAQDRQQVKNVSREVKLLTKSLGLEQDFVARNNSIADLADNKQWDALDEELEAVENELAAAMAGRGDDELIMLMTLGCWLRTLEIASSHLAANYSGDAAKILRQPAVCSYFSARLEALPAKSKTAPIITELHRSLPAVAGAICFPVDNPPSPEAVADLRTLTATLLNRIAETPK